MFETQTVVTQDAKEVLSKHALRRVPSRAIPDCQCEGEILIIAREYGGGEHLWLECGVCYLRGKQAIPKHLAQRKKTHENEYMSRH